MDKHEPECLGHYDFGQIAEFAHKRFVEGCDTVTLMQQARSETEKEEVALVALLDLREDEIASLELSCRYAQQCQVTNCRARLRSILKQEYLRDKR